MPSFAYNTVQEEIVDQIVSMGFPKKLVMQTLANKNVFNQITVTYYLIIINFS